MLIVILATALTLGLLFNGLTKKSFYSETGTVNLKGLTSETSVYKDDFGVPHIIAENEKDLYFSLGYIHARDRLWQMDIARRVAQGRLAEIFGKDVIAYDKLFRTIGINKIAAKLSSGISEKTKNLLESYSNGVNRFISENSNKLPLEFDILNYKPEPWTPENSLMITRLMGWELNISWYTDYTFAELVNKFGREKAKDLYPSDPEDGPFIIKDQTGKKDTASIKVKPKQDTTTVKNKKKTALLQEDESLQLASLGENYFNTVRDFRDFIGIPGTHNGSNSWVVNGSRTESGKPLLANDPHLSLQVPSKWYEVQLFDNSTKLGISGFSIAGTPGVIIGHNNFISWGLTNLMNDDNDFYILKKDSSVPNIYFYKDSRLPLDSSTELIRIRNEVDPVEIKVYNTKLGPVVSNLEKTGMLNKGTFPVADNLLLVSRWTGQDYSDEIETFYNIDHSKNWNDFRSALQGYGTPAMNFIYVTRQLERSQSAAAPMKQILIRLPLKMTGRVLLILVSCLRSLIRGKDIL
jgi:penicillin amidase